MRFLTRVALPPHTVEQRQQKRRKARGMMAKAVMSRAKSQRENTAKSRSDLLHAAKNIERAGARRNLSVFCVLLFLNSFCNRRDRKKTTFQPKSGRYISSIFRVFYDIFTTFWLPTLSIKRKKFRYHRWFSELPVC